MSYRKWKTPHLGVGSIVRKKSNFRLKRIPLGAKGKVVDYHFMFGEPVNPVVEFETHPGQEFIVDDLDIEVLKRVPVKGGR